MNIYFRIGRGLINRGCAWVIVFVTCLGSVHGGSMDAIMGAERAHDGEWRFSEWRSRVHADNGGQEKIHALRLIDTGSNDVNYILIEFTRSGDLDQYADAWIQTAYHEGAINSDGVLLSHDSQCDILIMTSDEDEGQEPVELFRVTSYESVDRQRRNEWRTTALTGAQTGRWICVRGDIAASSYRMWDVSINEDVFEIRWYIYGTVRLVDGFSLAAKFTGTISRNEGVLDVGEAFIVRGGVLGAWPIRGGRSHTAVHEDIKVHYEEECDRLTILFPSGDDEYRVLRFRR